MSRAQAVVGVPVALAVARFRFAKLRRVRPRPYALAEVPPDMPPILSSETYGPGLTNIVLEYGHPLNVSKPLIQIQTCFSEEECDSPSLEDVIWHLCGASIRSGLSHCHRRDPPGLPFGVVLRRH